MILRPVETSWGAYSPSRGASVKRPYAVICPSQIERFEYHTEEKAISRTTYTIFNVQEEYFEAPEYQLVSTALKIFTTSEPAHVVVGEEERKCFLVSEVSASEFRPMLRFYYDRDKNAPLLGVSDYISILKVATRFGITSLRDEAIDQLENHDLGWPQKASLGRLCSVPHWFYEGNLHMIQELDMEICASDDVIGELGLEDVLRLCRVRESLVKPYPGVQQLVAFSCSIPERLTFGIAGNALRESSIDSSPMSGDLVGRYLDIANSHISKDSLARVTRRPASLTYDEVKLYREHPDHIRKLLRARFSWKASQGRFRSEKSDVVAAFEEEFESDLDEIKSRGWELRTKDPRRIGPKQVGSTVRFEALAVFFIHFWSQGWQVAILFFRWLSILLRDPA